ncbi:MAG: histidine phosphatase family protein [Magnetococcales bacterium]|nr:histidine phosphatase family protein [Magnetococcales bacterium]
MPRQLLIMRHAKSSWDDPSHTDFQRPLAGRGLRDAPRMGHWLHTQKLRPDCVLSSPAQRAQQTTLMVCNVLGIPQEAITWNQTIYNADLKDLLDVLATVPGTARLTLLVGHNPGLEFLYTFLGGRQPDCANDGELIKTASQVLLRLPEDWSKLSPCCGSVVWVKHPKDLSATDPE